MLNVTKEQIARAKEVEILDYLQQNEPDNIKKFGNEYRLKDHDSLTISNNLWHWHSQEIGGKNVIDYLMKVRGFSFVDAVIRLSGGNYRAPPVKQNQVALTQNAEKFEQKQFILPPRNRDNSRVIAYLQSRGIEKNIILDCINRGDLYESEKYHNCVFVGRNVDGKAKFAFMRGTFDNFKSDVAGSDKQFGFSLSAKNVEKGFVAVFESAIDVLSHATMFPNWEGWRLSLGGTSLASLTHFCDFNVVSKIYVCTDNDVAGDDAHEKISRNFSQEIIRVPPKVGKDFNDALLAMQKDERMKQKSHYKANER
jgi:hypothetical protein